MCSRFLFIFVILNIPLLCAAFFVRVEQRSFVHVSFSSRTIINAKLYTVNISLCLIGLLWRAFGLEFEEFCLVAVFCCAVQSSVAVRLRSGIRAQYNRINCVCIRYRPIVRSTLFKNAVHRDRLHYAYRILDITRGILCFTPNDSSTHSIFVAIHLWEYTIWKLSSTDRLMFPFTF